MAFSLPPFVQRLLRAFFRFSGTFAGALTSAELAAMLMPQAMSSMMIVFFISILF
jgi:hypothetical protein